MAGAAGFSQIPVGPTSGGKVYAFNNVSTAPAQVAPANPQRNTITFHNPGAVDIWIAPALAQTTGSSVALVPSLAALGGCFRLYADGGQQVFTGECQGAWQAFAASGTTNALTVVDSNT